MKRSLMVVALAVFVGAMGATAEEQAAPAPAKKAAPCCSVCAKCQKVAEKATKCCEQDMAALHILAIKDGTAECCACGADCEKCGEIKDGKCACGKDVVKCSLKGKFVCEKYKTIADKAGKCGCGADLAEVK